MPRKPRRFGNSGYYHVMMRGIDRSIIFESPEDYRTFLSILDRCRAEESVTICAYCLMSNHLHLLLYSQADCLSRFIKKIGVRYVAYFNNKYLRVGHLFQDRYKSEPIENETYLLQTFRYILQNPAAAGICSAELYPWSSYSLYGKNNSLTDTSVFYDYLGDYSAFSAFIDDASPVPVMDYNSPTPHDDSWTVLRAKELLKIDNLTVLRDFSKPERNHAIRLLLSDGLSVRQIARITGFSRGLIARLIR